MQPIQLFALGVTIAHACLLAGVFFGSSLQTHAYVSTEVHALLFFKTFLTVIVITEAAFCGAYIYDQGGSAARVASGEVFVALSVIGWAILASFPTETAEHLAGAVIFISSTAAYGLYFVQAAQRARPALYTLWTLAALSAAAFGSLYFAKLYPEAAALEWAAFTLDALTLATFFFFNAPSDLARSEGLKARGEPMLLTQKADDWEWK